MKYLLAFMFMLINTCQAMSYGNVFPTRVPVKTFSSHCVVKTITKLTEIVSDVDVDNTRRILELREDINEANAKPLTYRNVCGSTFIHIKKYV